MLIVFGCIIVSFVLSSLKQRHDIESWGLFAGTAFNNLATTVTGRHGIIAPQLHYYPKKDKKKEETTEDNSSTRRISTGNVIVTDLASSVSSRMALGSGLPTISEGVVVGVVREGHRRETK